MDSNTHSGSTQEGLSDGSPSQVGSSTYPDNIARKRRRDYTESEAPEPNGPSYSDKVRLVDNRFSEEQWRVQRLHHASDLKLLLTALIGKHPPNSGLSLDDIPEENISAVLGERVPLMERLIAALAERTRLLDDLKQAQKASEDSMSTLLSQVETITRERDVLRDQLEAIDDLSVVQQLDVADTHPDEDIRGLAQEHERVLAENKELRQKEELNQRERENLRNQLQEVNDGLAKEVKLRQAAEEHLGEAKREWEESRDKEIHQLASSHNSQLQKLEKHTASLNNSVSEYEGKLRDSEHRLEDLEGKLAESEEATRSAQASEADAMDQLRRACESEETMLEALGSSRTELQTLKRSLQEESLAKEQYQAELGELKSTTESSQQALRVQVQEVQDARRELEETLAKSRGEVEALQKSLEQQSLERQRFEVELNKAKSAAQEAQDARREIEETLAKSRGEVEALQKSLEQQSLERQRFGVELNKAKLAAQEVETELVVMRRDYGQAQQRLSEAESTLSTAQDLHQQLTLDFNTLKETSAAAAQSMEASARELEDTDNKNQELREAVGALNAQLEPLRSVVEKLEGERTVLLENKSSLEQRLATFLRQGQVLDTYANQTEYLQVALSNSQDTIGPNVWKGFAELLENLAKPEISHSTTTVALLTAKRATAYLRDKLEMQSLRKEEFERNLASASTRVTEIEASLREERSRGDDLQRRLLSQGEELGKEISDARADASRTEAEMRATNADLTVQLGSARRQHLELRSAHENCQEAIDNHRENEERLAAECVDLRAELARERLSAESTTSLRSDLNNVKNQLAGILPLIAKAVSARKKSRHREPAVTNADPSASTSGGQFSVPLIAQGETSLSVGQAAIKGTGSSSEILAPINYYSSKKKVPLHQKLQWHLEPAKTGVKPAATDNADPTPSLMPHPTNTIHHQTGFSPTVYASAALSQQPYSPQEESSLAASVPNRLESPPATTTFSRISPVNTAPVSAAPAPTFGGSSFSQPSTTSAFGKPSAFGSSATSAFGSSAATGLHATRRSQENRSARSLASDDNSVSDGRASRLSSRSPTPSTSQPSSLHQPPFTLLNSTPAAIQNAPEAPNPVQGQGSFFEDDLLIRPNNTNAS